MLAKLFFILTLTLTPKAATEPRVVSVGSDGLHVLQNPFKFPIEMELDCGIDWETVVVYLEPKSMTPVRIVDPATSFTPHCFYRSFTKR